MTKLARQNIRHAVTINLRNKELYVRCVHFKILKFKIGIY